MHSDTTAIALREDLRATLADKMRAFERQHGRVKTTPIIVRANTGSFNKAQEAAEAKSRRRGVRASAALAKAKAGTAQARKNAVLREEWTT